MQHPVVNVTFCAVVRNRAKITLEWVLYHVILGVQRFILFDDGSEDHLRDVLHPLVELGIVTVFNVSNSGGLYRFRGSHPLRGPLLEAYGDCMDIEAERAESEDHDTFPWVGLLDSDEFIVLPSGLCISEVVSNVLLRVNRNDRSATRLRYDLSAKGRQRRRAQVGHVAAVAIPWWDVGHLPGDLFDDHPTQFHRTGFFFPHAPDPIQRVKVIARADLPAAMTTAHNIDKIYGGQDAATYFPNGDVMSGPGWFAKPPPSVHDIAIIFHFHSRSLVSWMQRFLDGFADDVDKTWPFEANTLFGRWAAGSTASITTIIRSHGPGGPRGTSPALSSPSAKLRSALSSIDNAANSKLIGLPLMKERLKLLTTWLLSSH
jgi:hypothetical protein